MSISWVTIRMFVHVVAAVVWVGGQLVVAGLLPVVRQFGENAPRLVARQFAKLSWPAMVVVTFTGIWNAFSVNFGEANDSYRTAFGYKMVCYLLTLVGALAHSLAPLIGRNRPTVRRVCFAGGGVACMIGALGALFFAVSLKY